MGVLPKKPPNAYWSSTLRLPKSSFPHRTTPEDQTKYLRNCTDHLYSWQNRFRASQKPFILHDGPPYANGALHLGHAMNKILKDIICRVQLIQGARVKYVPGFDCHGLPIEIKALEQQRQETSNGESPILDAVAIRRAARALATKTVEEQKKGFQQWAIMADWDNAWKTMDPNFVKNQLGVFLEMMRKGLIFRRHKPVYWSPSSRTALAEAELEYNDNHKSTAAYVAFPVTKILSGMGGILRNKEGDPLENISAVVWTTTPWTLPANRAIAIHRDLEYCVIKHRDRHLIIAKSQVENVANMCFSEERITYVVDSIMGFDLEGIEYVNALRGTEGEPQPFIHADFVTQGSGSGLVHCAPGHGMDDYEVCTKLGITAFAPLDDGGCFTSFALPDDPSRLEGISVLKNGSKEVLNILGDKVLGVHTIRHKYPYDWRTKRPVIVRATEQWFADVGSIKNKAHRNLEAVKFIPETGRRRLESFVKGRSEWCISRQRAWGVPIPALYNELGQAELSESSVKHIMSVIDERGIDAWFTDPDDDKKWVCPDLPEAHYRRGKDTMDVWFDSGSSWTLTEGPADVYCEGTDQHRGWFQSSLLTYTSAAKDDGFAPYKTLITHGMTLDDKGRKMSKSIGNGIVPSQVMEGSLLPPMKQKDKSLPTKYDALGTDALRLWVASSDYTSDVSVGQPVLKSIHTGLVKYRNITKMLLGSMFRKSSRRTDLDIIALIQLQTVMGEVFTAYKNYEFYKGIKALDKWLHADLSSFYMDAIKDRLYTGDGGSVFPEIYDGLMAMLAPITPMLVEEAWDHTPEWVKQERIHPLHQIYVSTMSSINTSLSKACSADKLDKIRNDIPLLLSANSAIKAAQEEARGQKLIGSSLQCSVFFQLPSPEIHEIFKRYLDSLPSIFVVSKVELGTNSIPVPVDELEWKFSRGFNVGKGNDCEGHAWVLPVKEGKCERCWRYVVEDKNYHLCDRCNQSL